MDAVLASDYVWVNSSVTPELESFIEVLWPTMSLAQRNAVAERILSLVEDIKTSKELPDRNWPMIQVVQWLAILIPLGLPSQTEGRAEAVFAEWSAITGVTQRAERSASWGSTRFVDEMPEEVKSFEALKASEVLTLCSSSSYSENVQWSRGIARALQEAVSLRPEEYLIQPEGLGELRVAAYAAAVIDGFRRAGESGKHLPVVKVCDVCTTFLRLEYLGDTMGVKGAGLGLSDEVLTSIARLIEHVSDRFPDTLEIAELNSLLSLCKALVQASAGGRSYIGERDIDDVFMDTLNSSDGPVALAVCSLATRSLRQLRINDERAPAMLMKSAYQASRDFVAGFVIGSRIPRVRAAIGLSLHDFILHDPEWATLAAKEVFDKEEEALWLASWTTYLRSHRSADDIEVMRSEYEHALTILAGRQSCPEWGRSTAKDIAIYWLLGYFNEEDRVIKMLMSGDTNLIAAATWQVGRSLKDNEESDLTVWKQAVSIWKTLSNATASQGKAGSGAMQWIDSAPDALGIEDVEQLIVEGPQDEDRFLDRIWSFIEARVESEPEAAARCSLALVDAEKSLTNDEMNCISRILRAVNRCGSETARLLVRTAVDTLLRKGFYSFEPLIDELNS
jgi:hypothetical protein